MTHRLTYYYTYPPHITNLRLAATCAVNTRIFSCVSCRTACITENVFVSMCPSRSRRNARLYTSFGAAKLSWIERAHTCISNKNFTAARALLFIVFATGVNGAAA